MTLITETLSGTSLARHGEPRLISTRRGSVEYATFGDGPAVLCLHGAMGGYDQSLLLARTLGESGYRYVGLSRPGYLGTPLDRGRSPEQQADLYAAVLDALGLERVAVMAVSGGGPSAIRFALRHGERCWALVLVSTCADKVNNRLPLAFKLMKPLARLPWFASAALRKTAEQPELTASRSITDPELLARTIAHETAWPLLQELQISTVTGMAQRFAGTENDVSVTRTWTHPLERIGVPTLIVHGTRDPLVPFALHAQVFAARIPGSELVALEGGEHAAIFTHLDEARARVSAFLRQHSTGTAA
jgi:pimeloyl-ACP methyl ester carboxylesterase